GRLAQAKGPRGARLDPERVIARLARGRGGKDHERLGLCAASVALRESEICLGQALGGGGCTIRTSADALDETARAPHDQSTRSRVAQLAGELQRVLVVPQLVRHLPTQQGCDGRGTVPFGELVHSRIEPLTRTGQVAGSTSNPAHVEVGATGPDRIGIALEKD